MTQCKDKMVVLATRNAGKVAELAALFKDLDIALVGLEQFPDAPEVQETGSTFMENALLKARATAQATGCVAVADDSGLEVEALNGAPGVFSARFSAEGGNAATPEKNNDKLAALLAGVPAERRGARFFCAMAACAPTGQCLTSSGVWQGRIAEKPAGEYGFGYDPLFFDPELGCTAAQMPPDLKNSRSHRGKAMRALLQGWPEFWKSLQS